MNKLERSLLKEAFLLAVKKEDLNAMRAAMAKGISVHTADSEGNTALHIAAQHQKPAAITLLVTEYDAEIDALNNRGFTPLHIAARKSDPACLKALLELGCDPNIAGVITGERALSIYLWQFTTVVPMDTVRAFLKAGADVNAPDAFGATPFMIAIQQKQLDAIKLFMPFADLSLKNSSGDTALHYAVKNLNEEDMRGVVLPLVAAGLDIYAGNDRGETPINWMRRPRMREDLAKEMEACAIECDLKSARGTNRALPLRKLNFGGNP